jgi:SAM-dependent methyltransferase
MIASLADSSGVHPMYVDGDYFARHPTWDVEDSPWKAEQVRRLVNSHGLAPESICEVGCGAGAILEEVARAAPSVEKLVGYEVSPQAYELAARRRSGRLSFKLADLAEEDPAVRFDLLLVMDVLEHVEDYLGFLRQMRERADYLILYLPLDLSALALVRGKLSYWRRELGHLHYFTKQTALASLEYAGYEVLDAFYAHHAAERPASRGAALMRGPRRVLTRANEDLSQALLGGASLVALAR